MAYQTYTQYLQSEIWKDIRKKAFKLYGRECSLCGTTKHLVVHHKKYPEVLGQEQLSDLQIVCENCHNVKLHNGSPARYRKRKNQFKKVLTRKQKQKLKKQLKLNATVKVYTKEEIREFEKTYFAIQTDV